MCLEKSFDKLSFSNFREVKKHKLFEYINEKKKLKPTCYAVLAATQDVYQPRAHDNEVIFNVIMHFWYQLTSSQPLYWTDWKLICHLIPEICFFKQMQLPSVMPILVLAMVQSTCTLLAALGERLTLLAALKFAHIVFVCKVTLRMLEWDVKVWKTFCISVICMI